MKLQRRTLLSAGLAGLAWTATQGLAAASNTRTRFVFHVCSTWGDLFDWLVDRSYAPITAELEKRGFSSMLVHSSVRGSDTPNAQLKAMQERIDASSSAHTMVGFYEVCPLKALPKVDNVYVSGSADGQIRPEWQQSAARRVLGVEPVVISGAGHANMFTKYAAQLADACVKGL